MAFQASTFQRSTFQVAGAAFVAAPLATAAPVIGTSNAVCAIAHILATAPPSIGAPGLTVVLAAVNFVDGAVVFGAPPLTEELAAVNLATAAPALGTPAVTKVLVVASLSPLAPTIATPNFVQILNLTAQSFAVATPDVLHPVFQILGILIPASLTVASVQIGWPRLLENMFATAINISPIDMRHVEPAMGVIYNYRIISGKVRTKSTTNKVTAKSDFRLR